MSFATPLLLWLLVPLAGLALARALWRGDGARLATADLVPIEASARRTWRLRTRWVPAALRWLAIALLVVAFARPREGTAVALIPQEGIDVVAVVDVSSSMQTSTVAGGNTTRLEAARLVLAEFVRSLEGDRVGLVAFQSSALTLSPLTHDYTALQRRINTLNSGLLPDGTAIGLGLLEGLTLLNDSPARSRVIVLLTDGQNNRGNVQPPAAAQAAEALGVTLYTIGFIGAESGIGVARADRQQLSTIAELTGGRYFDARTEGDLLEAYRTIGELERSQVGERQFTSFNEFAPWLIGIALLLIALEVAARAAIWRRYP
jgi:Ca-activated chloride channel family protein